MLEFVRDAFVRARDFPFITGPRDYPESRTKQNRGKKSRGMPRLLWLYPDVAGGA